MIQEKLAVCQSLESVAAILLDPPIISCKDRSCIFSFYHGKGQKFTLTFWC